MANEKSEIKWVDLVRGIKNPKLDYVLSCLTEAGVDYQIRQGVMAGYVIKIEEGQTEMVEELLNVAIGKFDFDKIPYADKANISGKAIIRVWDLPDDHSFFEEWVQYKSGVRPIASYNSLALVPTPEFLDVSVEEVEKTMPPKGKTLKEVAVEELAKEEEAFGPAPDREAVLTGTDTPTTKDVPDENEDDDDEESWADLGEDEEDEGTVTDDDEEFAAEEEDEEDWDTVYLQVDQHLKKFTQDFPVSDGKTLQVELYEVESSNISAIGYRVTNDPLIVVFYVKFKQGGSYYRYRPVAIANGNDLINEAVKKHMGRQEASVGSLFHTLLKEKADEGLIQCQRFNEEREAWVIVPTKAQRKSQNKAKAKG